MTNFVWKHPKSATVRTPSPLQSAYASPATNFVWKHPKSATVRLASRLQSAYGTTRNVCDGPAPAFPAWSVARTR